MPLENRRSPDFLRFAWGLSTSFSVVWALPVCRDRKAASRMRRAREAGRCFQRSIVFSETLRSSGGASGGERVFVFASTAIQPWPPAELGLNLCFSSAAPAESARGSPAHANAVASRGEGDRL